MEVQKFIFEPPSEYHYQQLSTFLLHTIIQIDTSFLVLNDKDKEKKRLSIFFILQNSLSGNHTVVRLQDFPINRAES